MITPSDRYGDLTEEDITELEELPEVDDFRELDFERIFDRNEVRSFERDFDPDWEWGKRYYDFLESEYDERDNPDYGRTDE